MIERLVSVLLKAGFDITHQELADALWLAPLMPVEGPAMRHAAGINAESSELRNTDIVEQAREDASRRRSTERITTARPDVLKAARPGQLFVPAPGLSSPTPGAARIPAVSVRVPTVEALPTKQAMNRALRPLKRRFPSPRTKVLDVDRTVDQIANGGPNVPVMMPAPERWLEIALVVDESASMRIWRQTAREFEILLTRHGSFRDVRPWFLNLDEGNVKLYSEAGLPNSPRRLRHPNELIDSLSRRLILILTDCAAAGWRNGSMFRAVREWGRRGPVALVQVLPERLWSATALSSVTVKLQSRAAGVSNNLLDIEPTWFNEPAASSDMGVPVINLEGWSAAPWARLVAHAGDAVAEGVAIKLADIEDMEAGEDERAIRRNVIETIPAEERLRRFRGAGSPEAVQLAGYLSSAPLVLPVMRLVQRAMMPVVRQVHLAEVFLSGLIRQITPAKEVGNPEEVVYDFYNGVRELLRATVRYADQMEVVVAVSRLIESQTGNSIDFQALLADPTGRSQQLVDPVGRQFADVTSTVLRRFGWAGEPRTFSRVLVVGSRRYDVEPAVQSVCEVLGRELARHGVGLVGRGWPGIDHLVARAFAAETASSGDRIDDRILHVVEPTNPEPDFDEGGSTTHVTSAEDETEVAVDRSDAAIVISGGDRTRSVCAAASRRGLTVLPLRGTGRAAQEIFDEMEREGGLFLIGDLGRPVEGREDAEIVVASAMQLLRAPRPAATVASALGIARDLVRLYLGPIRNHSEIAAAIRKRLQPVTNEIDPSFSNILTQARNTRERTLGYFLFQARPAAANVPELMGCFPVEQEEAGRNRETRPLWELLMCIEAAFSDGRLRPSLPSESERVLAQILSFLEGREDLDSGGECKHELRELGVLIRAGRLADGYNRIRETQPSGPQRTTAMTVIADQMGSSIDWLEPDRLYHLLGSGDGGLRLVAYAYLVEHPSPELLRHCADTLLSRELTPFGQYWALLAIEKVIATVPVVARPAALRSELAKLLTTLKPDSDRFGVLSGVLSGWEGERVKPATALKPADFESSRREWLAYAPAPRPLSGTDRWNVFISYRSVNRAWAANLVDVLADHGHRVFLDQFVLKPGDAIALRLGEALDRSQTALLLWSNEARDADWSLREYETLEAMTQRKADFQFVLVRLDRSPLPRFMSIRTFLDFSDYPDGPNGGELLRLLHAVSGLPLSPEAARFVARQDEVAKDAAITIEAAFRNGNADRLMELFQEGGLMWRTTPILGCQVADSLVRLGQMDPALLVLQRVEQVFPKAVRPRQLRALTLARRGRTPDLALAQEILGKLYAGGNRDPETLGIYGRTWMDRYNRSGDVSDLKQSRDLYAEAFESAPDDYYTGVNAASKSVLLGTESDLRLAKDFAERVQQIVGTVPVPGDYWRTATLAEVLLIQKKYKEAERIYAAAIDMAKTELGSHQSTWRQACGLMAKLQPTSEERGMIRAVFMHLPDCQELLGSVSE